MLITELVAKTVYFEDGMCVVCVLADKASISRTPLNQLSPLPKNCHGTKVMIHASNRR